jgi:ABC-type polysaccharide/polyol phosphate export permease
VRSETSDSGQWIESRPTRGRRALRFGELWRYRELVTFLAVRDVKVRYKQAVFGGVWAIVQPLAGAAIFTVVFGQVADLPSDGIPYLVFTFAGFALWTYLSTSVNTARASLISNSSLITKVYFPRLAAPLASVLPALIDLGVALVVLAVLAYAAGVAPGIAVLTAPLFLVGTVVVAFGTGTLLAALTVQYRDLQQVFTVLVQLWLFASPVAYSSSLIHDRWRWAYALNPMAGVLDGWRWSVLGGPPPGWELLVSAAVAGVLLVTGLLVFQRNERRFADVI